MEIVPYEPAFFEGVKALWAEAFPDYPPQNAAEVSIPAKMAVQPELFLVARDGDLVIGTVMAGYDGHRGWLYSVAVLAARQRQGVGAALIRAAEAKLIAMGCPKINLQVRGGNEAVVGFYERLGYVQEPRVSLGKRFD